MSTLRVSGAMEPRGTHLLVEIHGANREALDDVHALEGWLRRAAAEAEVSVVHAAFHRFHPEGVTGFLLLEESHLSIHTWPSHGYAALDFYTCGASDPRKALEQLVKHLGAQEVQWLSVQRGERKLASSADNSPRMTTLGEPWPKANRA